MGQRLRLTTLWQERSRVIKSDQERLGLIKSLRPAEITVFEKLDSRADRGLR